DTADPAAPVDPVADAVAGRPASVATAASPMISERIWPPRRGCARLDVRALIICWNKVRPGVPVQARGCTRCTFAPQLHSRPDLRFRTPVNNCGKELRRMGTFEELVDQLAEALDEAAEGIREALRSKGRPQKYLANRV